MKDSLFKLKDSEDRGAFANAIPVIIFLAALGYWLTKSSSAPDAIVADTLAQISDSDADGVADISDNCINTAGSATLGGCPPQMGYARQDSDRDNDGVFDSIDSCPDAAGSAIDNGCPADADGDGVADLDDPCPMMAGDSNGCPADQDKDGVADAIDTCPDMPGSAASNGCPGDSDSDGIIDASDRCPETPGDAGNDGCPIDTHDTDADNNSANDNAQDCPEGSGESVNGGCPPEPTIEDTTATAAAGNPTAVTDIDGDTVPDSVDQCPDIAGIIDEQGCPKDTDNLADADNRCAATDGRIPPPDCPQAHTVTTLSAQDQQILDSALAQVAFNSNSATLTQQSKQVLQNVAGLLTKYPQATLEIRGHTDSSGDAAANMQLSIQRARATASFIAGQGIDTARLTASGYGESQPVASNATSEGKRSNRRVEFELKF